MEPKLIHTAAPGRYGVADLLGSVQQTFDDGGEAMEHAEYIAKLNNRVYRVFDFQPKED